MLSTGEEILADIDQTLDQLIENADIINRISFNALFTSEVQALQKTQESLMARLMHMHELLEKDNKPQISTKKTSPLNQIENKLKEFGQLNARLIEYLVQKVKISQQIKKPQIRPYRKKRPIKTEQVDV
ncbi:hypothetical protein [Candidatus Rhabdochlamydia sp. T3358]|jgi:chaperonin cofactor prefoldin|uniref:hypothetical protein n=1 Tax=Candidatus Rhabdochlamydia sp. T3358 TaxID=2099795 RepID=UPI0010B6F6E6|nr:hypothetical protein [Candidatus Rhabdochlamydia sp. T3358]VHO02045.1 hypothetical protein RHT_00363 [Candidatus Rhabdochlamydia sp. T3358]